MPLLETSLKKIARGTGIVLAGLFLGLLLGFITRPIIARNCSEAEYGIYSLSLVIVTIAVTVSCLGLQEGATRFIAYFRGRNDPSRVTGTISLSIRTAAIASIVIATILFFSSEAIALIIFHTPALAEPLRIMAFSLPFLVMVNMLVSVFRGFGRMEPQAYFQSVMLSLAFLLFLTAWMLLSLPFIVLFYAYLAASIATFAAFSFYAVKSLPGIIGHPLEKGSELATREIFSFSLPLLGSALLSTIIWWMDTLMLGYFKGPDMVGLYNAARPLAQFISEPLAAMLVVYTPVATVLYAQSALQELRRNYTVITKWIVSLTMPVFLVLFSFPEAVLSLLFGHAYVTAAPVLRILALGYMVNNLFGPNQALLVAAGSSRFVMWSVAATAALNVILGLCLIPPWGVAGAAIGSVISLVTTRIVIATKIFLMFRIHAWSLNLLKPLAAAGLLALLFWLAVHGMGSMDWWMLALLFLLYCALYVLAVILTRSFDREDIALLQEIENWSGVNAAPLKKVLSKIIHL